MEEREDLFWVLEALHYQTQFSPKSSSFPNATKSLSLLIPQVLLTSLICLSLPPINYHQLPACIWRGCFHVCLSFLFVDWVIPKVLYKTLALHLIAQHRLIIHCLGRGVGGVDSVGPRAIGTEK